MVVATCNNHMQTLTHGTLDSLIDGTRQRAADGYANDGQSASIVCNTNCPIKSSKYSRPCALTLRVQYLHSNEGHIFGDTETSTTQNPRAVSTVSERIILSAASV